MMALPGSINARRTFVAFGGIMLAWTAVWALKDLLLDGSFPWLATSLGSFVFWTLAKLLIWILPAWWLINDSGRSVSGLLNVRAWRTWLPWGLAIGAAIAVTGFGPKLMRGEALFPGEFSIALLSVLTIAPVFEEFLMRGAVLGGLAERFSPRLANVIASALFVVLHLPGWFFMGTLAENALAPVGGALSIFALGLLFGWAAQGGKSVIAAMIAHFLNNLASA